MIEKPARGVRGYLLFNPFTGNYFFRVYDPEVDPTIGRRGRTDYDLGAEEIEVTIESGALSLYEYDTGRNHLSWSSEVLRSAKHPTQEQP